VALTTNERRHQAIGQRLLERDLVSNGLIRRRGLYERGQGAMARERQNVCDQLVVSFRRENLAGQDQILQDGLRVLRGKKPRHLQQSAKGRRLLRQLRAARQVLE
jgi:hypothetical protein